ncbi:MAG: hypothetical protein Q7S24_00065, partial [bacterium]|nr:hypothetical protein [bacterium]
NGIFLYERGIEPSWYQGGQIGRAQFLEHSSDGGWYALEIYYPKTKKTKIFAFDKNGLATESLVMSGKIDYWSFNSQGVIVSKNEKYKSKITFYNWQGKKIQTLSRGGVVSDIAMVSNLDKDVQVALLITSKNKTSGIVLWEPDSQSTREVALVGKNTFRLFGNHWLGVGQQSLLAFSSNNGIYQVFDSTLNERELMNGILRIVGE